MPLSFSKRARQIIHQLSRSQAKDNILVPYITLVIRYNLLHNSKLCIQIPVELQEDSNRSSDSIPFSELPNFLISQLEAQNITDSSSLWYQVAPLLQFILFSLREHRYSRCYPTLFYWYCREKHRYFFFFAFVKFKMAPKTYSTDELLRLQDAPPQYLLYERLYRQAKKDADLSKPRIFIKPCFS